MDNELINLLNEFTNNEYEFSLKSATFDKGADFCVIEIFYKDGVMLSSDKKSEINSVMLGIVPQNFRYELRFIKKFISEESIKEELPQYLKKNFPSITFKLDNVIKIENTFNIKLIIDTLSFKHVIDIKLADIIKNFYKKSFSVYDYNVELSEADIFVEDAEQLVKESYVEEEVDLLAPRKIEVENKEVYIGEEIVGPASYIKDKASLNEVAVFCGVIKGKKKRVFEQKIKENEEVSENDFDNKFTSKNTTNEITNSDAEVGAETETEKSVREKTIFRWNLAGFTGNISCAITATKQTKAKLEVLEENTSVIVRGKLRINKFSEDYELLVKDISTCTLPTKFEEKIVYKTEKPFYEWVKPEKYVSYKQDNLMNFFEEKIVPPYLSGKTFVCYDLETTGVHFESGDKIIEIGAVKIEDGKITESFSTLVNPQRSIPAEASKVNHIYDSDVENAITADMALQDFYKFTRGAIIIGYNNINFDNVFLIGQGKECRWNFDNATEDVYPLAQKYVFGVKNYRLITIAEKLGIALDNAHRALFDTIATAEVFIKLAENIK